MPPSSSDVGQSGPDTPRVGAGIDFTDPNSPLAPLYMRTSQVLAVALIGLVFVVCSLFPLWHTDLWGHLRFGQWMVEHGRIPDREPFCPWADDSLPFTQFYTLTQLPMYFAYDLGARLAGGDDLSRMAGGADALRALHALLTAARFAVLLAVFIRLGRSWPVALLGLGLIIVFGFLDTSSLTIFRPQTFGELLFAILLYPLSRDVLSRRAVVLVPAMMVLWANAHGSYLVGLGMVGIVLAGRVAELLATGPPIAPWRDRHAMRLGLVLVLSVVAVGLLNPYGPSFYARTLALARHPSLIGGVTEWQPLAFERAWMFMGSIVLLAFTQLAARTPIPARRLLPLLGIGVGVALQTRFVIWWAMIVPWVLVPLWAELAGRWPAALTPPASVPSLRKTLLAVILVAAMFTWSAPGGWLVQGQPVAPEYSVSSGTPWQLARQLARPDDAAARWSPELADVLRAGYPDGRFTGSIMASPMQGDFLMWALAPGVPVTYTHMHLFPPGYWEELGVVAGGQPGWYDVLDKYRVNLLVVEAESSPRLRDHLRACPEWKIVRDETGDAAKSNRVNRQLVAIRVKPRPGGAP